MGTRFEFVLLGSDEVRLHAVADEAIEIVERWDRLLSIFRPDSVATQLNRNAVHGPVPVEADVFDLLQVCAQMWNDTNGAFDPTVAMRMKALGFHDGDSPSMVDDASSQLEAPGMAAVILDERAQTVYFESPNVALDFGAIGKGRALDDVAALLENYDITDALVHGGTSTVIARGAPPAWNGWKVGLQDPREPSNAPPIAVVELLDGALSISAHHGRVLNDQRQSGHVLDPRTGQAAERTVEFAACIGTTGVSVDAWSTSCLVAGGRHASLPEEMTIILPREGEACSVDGPQKASVAVRKGGHVSTK